MQVPSRLHESYLPPGTGADIVNLTIGDLLRQQALEAPDRVGFVEAVAGSSESREWTYRQLLASAESTARALLARFSPGECIAVWSPNCAEWVLLQHGAAMAGIVLVTVNPAYVKGELQHVLSMSRAAGIFHAGQYRGYDMAAAIAQLEDHLPALRHAVDLRDLATFVAGVDQTIPLPLVLPEDTVQIQFTSGTTGKPKGARLHHKGVINAARFAAQKVGFPEGGVWATAMPLFHVGGCAGSELGAMSCKGTFVMQTAFDAGHMLGLIERYRVNHLHAVPTMVLALLEHPDRPGRDVSSLRTLMSGGSTVPESLVIRTREQLGCRFSITFGQTELNGVICQTSPDDTVERQTTTIGTPAPWMELKIADPVSGAIRPIGMPGEIWARGYQVMHGYYNLEEGQDPAITADGWLRTGDIAAMDEWGYLQITGRLKDCIIRGGENIYPREIEDVLLKHPGVSAVSIIGVPDPQWGEVVAAVLVLEGSKPEIPAIDFHHYCRAHLAPYKTPVMWFYIDELPSTTSGKIQKFALRQLIRDGNIVPEPFEKPVRQANKIAAL